MMKITIQYIRSVLDRLERLGWPQWKQQQAYEALLFRHQREEKLT